VATKPASAPADEGLYDKLYQVPGKPEMAKYGYDGTHLTNRGQGLHRDICGAAGKNPTMERLICGAASDNSYAFLKAAAK
jgi:hypothetical protein